MPTLQGVSADFKILEKVSDQERVFPQEKAQVGIIFPSASFSRSVIFRRAMGADGWKM